MEAFLLAVTILTVLALLLATHRFNHNITRYMPVETKVLYPQGQPFYLANTVGKWLALAAGIATAPLVMALIFIPYGSPGWIITMGAVGLVTLLIASIVLGFVFIKNCLMRKLKMGYILVNTARQLMRKAKAFFQTKTVARVAGALVLIALLPFLVQALTALIYIAGFVMAARFGLLDDVGEKEEDWSFGYSDEEYIEASNYYYYYDDD